MVLSMFALVPGLVFSIGHIQKAIVYAPIASGPQIAPIPAGAGLPELYDTFSDFQDLVSSGYALEDHEDDGPRSR